MDQRHTLESEKSGIAENDAPSLKPCPFCGSQPIEKHFMDYDAFDGYDRVGIKCEQCDFFYMDEPVHLRFEVIKKWNTRRSGTVIANFPVRPIETLSSPAQPSEGLRVGMKVEYQPSPGIVGVVQQITDDRAYIKGADFATWVPLEYTRPVAALSSPEQKDWPLTDEMILAACQAFFGKRLTAKSGGISGVSLTAKDRDYTFKEAFTKMWRGAISLMPAQPSEGATEDLHLANLALAQSNARLFEEAQTAARLLAEARAALSSPAQPSERVPAPVNQTLASKLCTATAFRPCMASEAHREGREVKYCDWCKNTAIEIAAFCHAAFVPLSPAQNNWQADPRTVEACAKIAEDCTVSLFEMRTPELKAYIEGGKDMAKNLMRAIRALAPSLPADKV